MITQVEFITTDIRRPYEHNNKVNNFLRKGFKITKIENGLTNSSISNAGTFRTITGSTYYPDMVTIITYELTHTEGDLENFEKQLTKHYFTYGYEKQSYLKEIIEKFTGKKFLIMGEE